MKGGWRPLIPITLGCTLAAALFGFGSDVFAFRSSYEGLGREELYMLTRLVVLIALGAILVFRGEWRGVVAAVVMVVAATSLEWALFPFAFDWAAAGDPSGYARKFGDVGRPEYPGIAVYDILSVGLAAAFAQGLRIMARVNPEGPRDG